MNSEQQPLLPPWAVEHSSFYDLCTRCGDCITSCPEQLLTPGSGGFPTPNFKLAECTFCTDCVSACNTQALTITSKNELVPWQQSPSISDQCLAQQSVFCRSCGDVCEPQAITFEWINSVGIPVIDSNLCSGCGACIGVCPNDAMFMQADFEKQESTKTVDQT